MELDTAIGIGVADGADAVYDTDGQPGLLQDLPERCPGGGLAETHLAAREFPHVSQTGVPRPGKDQHSTRLGHDTDPDPDCFHG